MEYKLSDLPQYQSIIDDDCIFPPFDSFFINQRTFSIDSTQFSEKCTSSQTKTKVIQKNESKKQKIIRSQSCIYKGSRAVTRKKITSLQYRIFQLERENESLRAKLQDYENSYSRKTSQCQNQPFIEEDQKQQISDTNENEKNRKSSQQSIQFENIQFIQSLAINSEMIDKSWIMIGTLMLMIGFKKLQDKGSSYTFKILQNSVDQIYKQMNFSSSKLELDFYWLQERAKIQQPRKVQERMQELIMQSKISFPQLKVENIDKCDMIYDSKIKFNTSYESMLAAVQHVKEHSWISM